ncbi:13314_t:CDS:10, partial [Entrophospora sp. SA101]
QNETEHDSENSFNVKKTSNEAEHNSMNPNNNQIVYENIQILSTHDQDVNNPEIDSIIVDKISDLIFSNLNLEEIWDKVMERLKQENLRVQPIKLEESYWGRILKPSDYAQLFNVSKRKLCKNLIDKERSLNDLKLWKDKFSILKSEDAQLTAGVIEFLPIKLEESYWGRILKPSDYAQLFNVSKRKLCKNLIDKERSLNDLKLWKDKFSILKSEDAQLTAGPSLFMEGSKHSCNATLGKRLHCQDTKPNYWIQKPSDYAQLFNVSKRKLCKNLIDKERSLNDLKLWKDKFSILKSEDAQLTAGVIEFFHLCLWREVNILVMQHWERDYIVKILSPIIGFMFEELDISTFELNW